LGVRLFRSAIPENREIPTRFLPQRNAKNSEARTYAVYSLRFLRSFAANPCLVAAPPRCVFRGSLSQEPEIGVMLRLRQKVIQIFESVRLHSRILLETGKAGKMDSGPTFPWGVRQNSSPSLVGQSCRSALNLGGAAAPPYRRCEEFCPAPISVIDSKRQAGLPISAI
jgi:hypothetical protein